MAAGEPVRGFADEEVIERLLRAFPGAVEVTPVGRLFEAGGSAPADPMGLWQ